MRKGIIVIWIVLLISLCAGVFLTGCNGNKLIQGKYFVEKLDGTLDESSWIELGENKWEDSTGKSGSYKLSENQITFLQNGEEIFEGTIKDGVLTIEVSGTVIYRKEPGQQDDVNNGEGTEYNITLTQNVEGVGSVEGAGKYVTGTERTITATITNTDYSWLGWYDGETKVSTDDELSYIFAMPAEDKTYEARWERRIYIVTANKNIDNAGIVDGEGAKEYGTTVTLNATSGEGYTWVGWFDGETKVSTDDELSYTFVMPKENKTYEARWSVNSYTVTTEQNTELGGTISGGGSKEYGTTVILTAETNDGYTWLGWYDGETKVSTGGNLTYTFVMSAEDKEFSARWMACPITLDINIPEAGSVFGVEGATALGADTTISAETNDGYTWLGWYDGETKVSTGDNLTYTFVMPAEGLTFQARWEIKKYTVTINKNIDEAGEVMGAGKYPEGTEVTIEAKTNAGYKWYGWYDGETKISENDELSIFFEMPAEDKTFEARWGKGDYDIDGFALMDEYIWFGEYPQTIKENSVHVDTTQDPDSRGYYLGDDDCYYAKVTATPDSSSYTFSTGATVEEDVVYYFKVEPIKWRILSENNGEMLIICESIIANKQYYQSTQSRKIDEVTVYANNYEHSDIRAWLNNGFYNTAFNDLQRALIQETEVDNSVESTGYDYNDYVCDNTFDKIFLPSCSETVNSFFGFNSNESENDGARKMFTSDYSRATGVWMNPDHQDNYGYGFWWLRSPMGSKSSRARYISEYGRINSDYDVDTASWGVVPALVIKLPLGDS